MFAVVCYFIGLACGVFIMYDIMKDWLRVYGVWEDFMRFVRAVCKKKEAE